MLMGDKELIKPTTWLDGGWSAQAYVELIRDLLDTREAVKYKLKTDRRDWIKDAMALRDRRDKETLCKCERERLRIRLSDCWLGLRMIRSFLKLLEEPDQFYQCFDYIRSTIGG